MIFRGSKFLWNPEHPQNPVTSSSAHFHHFLQVSLKSINSFWRYFGIQQPDKRWLSPHLLGGGNNIQMPSEMFSQTNTIQVAVQ